MQALQQTVRRPLECVWMPSGQGLACHWVQRQDSGTPTATSLAGTFEGAGDEQRKVA